MEDWEKVIQKEFGKENKQFLPPSFAHQVLANLPAKKQKTWNIPVLYTSFIALLVIASLFIYPNDIPLKDNLSLPYIDLPVINFTAVFWLILVCWLFVVLDRFLHQRALLANNN